MKTASTYLVLWFFMVSAASFSFALTAFKKRNRSGFLYLIWLLVVIGIIFLISGFNLFIQSSELLVTLDYLVDTLIAILPILWLFFAISFSQNKKVLENPDLALLFIIPIISVLNIWSNDFTSLWYINRIISKSAFGYLLWVQFQYWFWIHFAYSYILFFIGILYLFASYYPARLFKKIFLALITLGYAILAVIEVLVTKSMIGTFENSTMIFLYSLLGIVFFIFLYRIDILEITPFSRTSLFDKLSDKIVVLDLQHRIIDANMSFATWKGIPKPDLFGESVFTLFPQWNEAHPLFAEIKNLTYSEAFVSSSGDQFFEIHSMPLYTTGRKIYGRLLVFHDITELNQSASMKIDFINTISHELRTPLTVIKQAVSYLNTEFSDDANAEEKKVLNIAHRNADRLNHMVNNLLEFQNLRLRKESLRFERYSYNCLIQDSLLVLKPWIDQSHIKIMEELEPVLPDAEMDVDKMRQVIVNIIDNAIRFTEKGFVRIKTSDFSTFVRIIVEDSGSGLSKEDQNRLVCSLDEFELLIQKNRSHIGLGLVISKEIIALHKGSIYAKNKADGGTIITLDMPYKQLLDI